MKKIFIKIIISFSIFSIFSYVNASEWLLEETLDINYWPENFEIDLPKIWNHYLKNKKNATSLKNFRAIDKVLREAFMEKYRNWDFDYNATNGIVDNYRLFIFHTNKYFYYLSVKEENPKSREADTAILKNYKNARAYIKKVKYIVWLEEKK